MKCPSCGQQVTPWARDAKLLHFNCTKCGHQWAMPLPAEQVKP